MQMVIELGHCCLGFDHHCNENMEQFGFGMGLNADDNRMLEGFISFYFFVGVIAALIRLWVDILQITVFKHLFRFLRQVHLLIIMKYQRVYKYKYYAIDNKIRIKYSRI